MSFVFTIVWPLSLSEGVHQKQLHTLDSNNKHLRDLYNKFAVAKGVRSEYNSIFLCCIFFLLRHIRAPSNYFIMESRAQLYPHGSLFKSCASGVQESGVETLRIIATSKEPG